MKTDKNGTNIYISSCVPDGGVYQYALKDNGSLELISKTGLDRPMYHVISGNKMYVVVRAPFAGNNDSGVTVYSIDDCGRLIDPSRIMSTMGEVACHILVDNGDIYCANYISGSVIKLPDNLVVHKGRGVHKTRQTSPHMHFVGLTPDERYVCAVDLGLDTIFLYNKDMSLFSSAKVPEGHGPRHLIFSDNGRYMFCANELASTLSVFEYDNGSLLLIDTVSILPAGFTGQNTSAAIRLRDGKIYISNRGHDSVSQVSFADGRLKLERTIDCGGRSPRDFNFIGDFMICTNEDSDNVTVLDCRKDFKQVSEIKLPKPLCVN